MIAGNGTKFTGVKMELCPICGEVFNNSRAADKHRVIDYKYALVRFPNGKVERIRSGNETQLVKLKMCDLLSQNNEARRCLTAVEMRSIGMNQEKNGAWNGGGNWMGAK